MRLRMSKEEALKELFITLKVSLKNAAIYNQDHPAFRKAVEELKKKTDRLLGETDPIRIGFTARSLHFEGREWGEEKTFRDIARIFHYRKVKALEISKGVTSQELGVFVAKFHLPAKELFRQGGLSGTLSGKDLPHIHVEELDYSQLLKGEGEEVKDVWTYLLQEAVEKQDPRALDLAAESFEKIAERLTPQDFEENEALPDNLHRLLAFMKKSGEEKFRSGAKVLVKAFTRSKASLPEPKMERLRILLSDIGEEDFASTLWEEIATDKDFDAISLSIFARLTEKEKQEAIAARLKEKAKTEMPPDTAQQLHQRIKELLSSASSPHISEIYRETLSSLLREVAVPKDRRLDRRLLRKHYRFALLNLLVNESRGSEKRALLEKILEEWEEITKQSDLEYLKKLSSALEESDPAFSSDPTVTTVRKKIFTSVEEAVLRGETSPYLEHFIRAQEHSTRGVNAYLRSIFTGGRISPFILQWFFRFFPDQTLYFMINLEERASDSAFLDRMIEALKTIDSPLSLEILKSIYNLGKPKVKVKALRAMQFLSHIDARLLFSILKKGRLPLKKEALACLVRHKESRNKALDMLLAGPSPYGIRNRALRRHIRIAVDLGLEEARGHLLALTGRKHIWNRRLRREARNALEALDGRKD